MNAAISSRTPEGDPSRCPSCGNEGCIEPSRPPGDVPCPACGQLLWLAPAPRSVGGRRISGRLVEGVLRTERRRPMFGLRATALRSVGRLIRATRRLVTSRPEGKAEPLGVYDHWLDG